MKYFMIVLIFSFVLGCTYEPPIEVADNSAMENTNNNNQSGQDVGLETLDIVFSPDGCCDGHIVTIDRDGSLTYLVADYRLPDNDGYTNTAIPTTFHRDLIVDADSNVKMHKRLGPKVMSRIRSLAESEVRTSFNDKNIIDGAWTVAIYLNGKLEVSGYEGFSEFPKNARSLIDQIRAIIDLKELPSNS